MVLRRGKCRRRRFLICCFHSTEQNSPSPPVLKQLGCARRRRQLGRKLSPAAAAAAAAAAATAAARREVQVGEKKGSLLPAFRAVGARWKRQRTMSMITKTDDGGGSGLKLFFALKCLTQSRFPVVISGQNQNRAEENFPGKFVGYRFSSPGKPL